MTAAISPAAHADYPDEPDQARPDGPGTVSPVVVRRNAGLAALVGAAASATAIAYLWRATQSGAPLDWALCLVTALVGAAYLAYLVDARTPLLVADELGVRVRLGHQWRGLPWDAVASVHVRPRRGRLRDGRLSFAPHSLGRALDGLDARGRRAAAANQKAYGAALAVPLGLTTRVSARGEDLAGRLALLARGRAEVVVLLARPPEPDTAGEPPAEPGDRRDDEPVTGVATGELSEPDRVVGDRAAARCDAARGREPGADEEVGQRLTEDATDTATGTGGPAPATRESRGLLGGLGAVVSRVARGGRHDVDADQPTDPAAEAAGLAGGSPCEGPIERTGGGERTTGDPVDEPTADPAGDDRTTAEPALRAPAPTTVALRGGLRAQLRRDDGPAVLGSAALLPDPADPDEGSVRRLPEAEELRRTPQPFDDGRVRPLARLGERVDPLVVEEFVTEPACGPVIGPELAAARTRVGLSVDELAERTRIRPHVIESIEVDDFGPCGGDFYARGHLRTLARVLGRDADPMLEQFDRRYASAPVNARKVFEAELATGMTGSMRTTTGGAASWPLLIGVVLVLVLTWGVVRLFAAEPQETLQSPVSSLDGSAGLGAGPVATRHDGAAGVPSPNPLRVALAGTNDSSHVVVRDRTGEVVWAGEIALGESRVVRALPPVEVRAKVGGAVEVEVSGKSRGAVGTPGQPGLMSVTRPAG